MTVSLSSTLRRAGDVLKTQALFSKSPFFCVFGAAREIYYIYIIVVVVVGAVEMLKRLFSPVK